jgi:2-amino-4-hydroxy-6-hydroxymethyldihydropteridine diphosphokinase
MSTRAKQPGRRRRAAVAFGSNLGNRVQNIESALTLMENNGINVVKTSSLYETKPMYNEDQGPFLNGACEAGTALHGAG